MANLGFIGIGIMGKPMAGHLLAASVICLIPQAMPTIPGLPAI